MDYVSLFFFFFFFFFSLFFTVPHILVRGSSPMIYTVDTLQFNLELLTKTKINYR